MVVIRDYFVMLLVINGMTLFLISVRLLKRKMEFLGHCYRSKEYSIQPIAHLLFWDYINMSGSKRKRGGQKANFVYTLMIACELDILYIMIHDVEV